MSKAVTLNVTSLAVVYGSTCTADLNVVLAMVGANVFQVQQGKQ